ncbi:MAG: hypothetical protein LRY71_09825 [Bacillaceae bacterium]|nr:hypothetical protein [Bacillaceae bacterium]
MKKWFPFFVSVFFCLSIWGYLIYLIFIPKEFPMVEHSSLVIEEQMPLEQPDSDIIDEALKTKENKAEKKQKMIKSIRKRGIHKEDLAFLAPDGTIAIDELLDVLEIKGWEN